MKTCITCGVEQPLAHFYSDRQRKDGRNPRCRDCVKRWRVANLELVRSQQADWYSRNGREYHRRYVRGLKYGLSQTDYEALLARQGGVCAICGTAPRDAQGGLLCVDHSHSTELVRGLLCHQCNRGLSQFRDRPDLLATAITYLGRHQNSASQ